MSEKKSFYITTTLPYVNSDPHIGFAMEIIQADIIARFKKSQGFEVFFNTGTDEHGQKVFAAAQKAGMDPQKYTDELSETFERLKTDLGLSEDLHFIRTTSDVHKKAAQEMWKLCDKAGYIEKKQYKIKYCTGCELEKTDSELVDGRCLLHPDRELEIREEDNYFFKFSQLASKLIELYQKPNFVIPDFRLNEIRALIDRGLEDFSISRLKEKMSWGVAVPGDEDHVMYVWFDALTSYISTLGWPDDTEKFNKFWDGENNVQFAGKDQVRQQAAMWQAMLIAAELPPTSQIVIHGFLNLDGQKMSKSLGNVISPQSVIDEFGLEALRYFVAREFNQFEDTEISLEKLKESYNSGLANGLGNLVARTTKMAASYEAFPSVLPNEEEVWENSSVKKFLEKFELKNAIDEIWVRIGAIDKAIQDQKPFQEIKTNPEKAVGDVQTYIHEVYKIACELKPFMPTTSEKIIQALRTMTLPENLFPRKD